MNDEPTDAPLQPMLTIDGNQMVNAITNPTIIGDFRGEVPGEEPANDLWTHRYRPSGELPEHTLFDQIWLSPRLAQQNFSSYIGRRYNLTGDGSDHDPVWISINLD